MLCLGMRCHFHFKINCGVQFYVHKMEQFWKWGPWMNSTLRRLRMYVTMDRYVYFAGFECFQTQIYENQAKIKEMSSLWNFFPWGFIISKIIDWPNQFCFESKLLRVFVFLPDVSSLKFQNTSKPVVSNIFICDFLFSWANRFIE